MKVNNYILKLEGETASQLNALITNLCTDYYLKHSDVKVALQQALRTDAVKAVLADEIATILLHKSGIIEKVLIGANSRQNG